MMTRNFSNKSGQSSLAKSKCFNSKRRCHVSAIDPSLEDGEDRVDALIGARNAARAAKDFKEADRIRGELEAMGIMLKDAKDPKTGELVTTWEVAR